MNELMSDGGVRVCGVITKTETTFRKSVSNSIRKFRFSEGTNFVTKGINLRQWALVRTGENILNAIRVLVQFTEVQLWADKEDKFLTIFLNNISQ